MTQVSYRKAIASDAETICSFQVAMAWETEKFKLNPEICLLGVRAVFEDSHRGQYYVCHLHGKVIGSLLITYEWSDWRNGVVWWIQSVFIDPEYRGQKFYSQFYEYIKELSRTNPSVQGLRLYVDKRNEVAQKIYSKLGMNGNHYQVFEWMKS